MDANTWWMRESLDYSRWLYRWLLNFDAKSTRLRITDRARLDESAEAIADLPGAKRLIRVGAEYIFYNCPRYIPRMEFVEESVYAPRCDYTPPEPEWKSRDYIREVLNEP